MHNTLGSKNVEQPEVIGAKLYIRVQTEKEVEKHNMLITFSGNFLYEL